MMNHKASWCFYKQGRKGHHGKFHYLEQNSWIARCGHWAVREEEQKWIVFITMDQIRPTKVCRACVGFMGLDAEYEKYLKAREALYVD